MRVVVAAVAQTGRISLYFVLNRQRDRRLSASVWAHRTDSLCRKIVVDWCEPLRYVDVQREES